MNKIKFVFYLNVIIFASFFLAVFVFLYIQKNNAQLNLIYQNVSFIQRDVIYYDEVLTMSARMYAATGNETWKKRYDLSLPVLDGSLQKLMNSIELMEKKSFVDETSLANDRLVEMEKNPLN